MALKVFSVLWLIIIRYTGCYEWQNRRAGENFASRALQISELLFGALVPVLIATGSEGSAPILKCHRWGLEQNS